MFFCVCISVFFHFSKVKFDFMCKQKVAKRILYYSPSLFGCSWSLVPQTEELLQKGPSGLLPTRIQLLLWLYRRPSWLRPISVSWSSFLLDVFRRMQRSCSQYSWFKVLWPHPSLPTWASYFGWASSHVEGHGHRQKLSLKSLLNTSLEPMFWCSSPERCVPLKALIAKRTWNGLKNGNQTIWSCGLCSMDLNFSYFVVFYDPTSWTDACSKKHKHLRKGLQKFGSAARKIKMLYCQVCVCTHQESIWCEVPGVIEE